MAKQIGWPFYPSDYERDTKRLQSATEHGCYFLLLKHYWTHGSLPEDDQQLRDIVGLPPPQWKKHKPLMQSFFYDGWKHKRIERDLKRAGRFRAKQSGRARSRWETDYSVENYIPRNDLRGRSHIAPKSLKKLNPAMPPASKSDATTDYNLDLTSLPRARAPLLTKAANREKAGASFHQQKPSKQHRAQQAWENDLRHELGPADYARAIDLLAADPDLVERATKAEIRKPGSGALAAMLGLSVREAKP